jgi:GT2 family glycosyltransferase/glycosyltransferase involved in cell wall biosynthesis
MSGRTDDLTIVVVTYNSSSVVADCLVSITDSLSDIGHRMVVVDNASTDSTHSVVQAAAPHAQWVQTGRNAGYAAAINTGLAAAQPAGAVLVLNPDVRLLPGSVPALSDALVRSGAGIAVPRLLTEDGHVQQSQRRDPTVLRALGEAVLGGPRAGRHRKLGEVVVDPTAYQEPGWVDWATGAVMMISKACREAVGRWDESFFLYSEETDYCLRARQAGFGVRFVPAAEFVHVGGDLESSPALRKILIRSKLRLFRRTHGRAASLAYRAAVTLNEGLRAATGSQRHRTGLAAAVSHQAASTPRTGAGFVVFSAQDYWYHNRAHSDVQLARAIARERTVVLVNSLGMRMPTPGRSSQVVGRVLRKLRSTAHTIRRPEPELPNLYVMSPVILPFYGNARMRALNAAVVRWQVRAVLRSLGMRAPHALVTIPTAWDVVAGMRLGALLANRSDKYSAFTESNSDTMADLETSLLSQADVGLYVNHGLMEEERPLVSSGSAVFLGHGVDYERFAAAGPADVPADLAEIQGPRIGFFGGLDDYVVDFNLLGLLAKEFPDASVVLIGAATCDVSAVTAHPNVHWLGARPYDQIPSYGAGFDVAIMPWLQSEWIKNCNPIKTKEYLALGVPVVSTFYPESMYVDHLIAVAKDYQDFLRLVREAMAGNGVSTAEQRRASVQHDTWSDRAAEVIRLADGAAS